MEGDYNYNMKTYTVLKNSIVFAKSDKEFVEKLNINALFLKANSIEEYMDGFSKQARNVFGVNIRVDEVEHFVKDLQKYGILKVELPN